MKEYQDDKTMEDDDVDINGQDDGMPCVCKCARVFELHDGYSSNTSNEVICEICHSKEETQEEIEELEEATTQLRILGPRRNKAAIAENWKKIAELKLKL